MTTILTKPYSLSATYPAWACCGCSIVSAKETHRLEAIFLQKQESEGKETARRWFSGELDKSDQPLHTTVYYCRSESCNHLSCKEHHINGLCEGCWYEQQHQL